MWVLVLVMLLVCIGFPLLYAWRIFRLDEPSMAEWLLVVADATVLVALVLLVGRWDMAGYYTRLLVVAAFLAALVRSLARHLPRPWLPPAGSVLRGLRSTLVSLVLLGAALVYVGYGALPPGGLQDLAFPLRDGRFMVAQGGRNSLLNHHFGHAEQRYAADMTAIDAFGFRAAGLVPKDLERYAIYGASVVSPCAGTVVAARDDLPDLIPPERDSDNPRGNHAIIDCGGLHVELAHLQPESVGVAVGERLAAGDPVGRVGNSGNTTEPHLHVHAVDPLRHVGVPITFGGRAPVRNRTFVN